MGGGQGYALIRFTNTGVRDHNHDTEHSILGTGQSRDREAPPLFSLYCVLLYDTSLVIQLEDQSHSRPLGQTQHLEDKCWSQLWEEEPWMLRVMGCYACTLTRDKTRWLEARDQSGHLGCVSGQGHERSLWVGAEDAWTQDRMVGGRTDGPRSLA